MFRYLASLLTSPPPPPTLSVEAAADTILSIDARSLTYLMDSAWTARTKGQLPAIPQPQPAPIGVRSTTTFRVTVPNSVAWEHLIYAYLVENTRILEIFRRAIWELLHGERFGLPLSEVTYAWLETTEAVFFRDFALSPFALSSRIRPDLEASRRNAYYRMFGMDLNHGRDGATYPYVKPGMANRDFVGTFEEFLRTVWRAIINVTNTSGSRETDQAAIADLAIRLQSMLTARRGTSATGSSATGASLARDEFVHVSTLEWFHLTIEANTSVVGDLKAAGPSPEERLRLIGERVGVPAHGRAHSYFQLAPAISGLLTQIELGWYSDPSTAPNLYALVDSGGNPNAIRANVMKVINHWSLVTGRDMKAGGVMVSPRTEIPPLAGVPGAVPVGAAGTPQAGAPTNGRTPTGAGSR